MRVFLARAAIAGASIRRVRSRRSPPAAAARRPAPSETLAQRCDHGLTTAAGASGAYVVDLTTGRTLFAVGPGRRAAAGVGREALHDLDGAASLRAERDADDERARLGRERLERRLARHPVPEGRRRPDVRLGQLRSVRLRDRRDDAATRRQPDPTRPASRRSTARSSATSPISTRCAGRRRPAVRRQPYVEGVLSGLAYDRGFANEQGSAFQNRPALFAAQQFAAALRAAGVTVPKQTRVFTGATPAAAQPLASVHSPADGDADPADQHALGQLLRRDAAQGHRRQLRRRRHDRRRRRRRPHTARRELRHPPAARRRLRPLAQRPHHVRARSSPCCGRWPANPDFRRLRCRSPGETGTLQVGLHGTAAQGRCRGKTGTLHDVANEVGYCTARDGHTLAFAFLMNAVDPTAGHALEDQMTVALAKYNG